MADKLTDFLKKWCFGYIKNKDIILNKIVSMDMQEDHIDVKYKDKEQTFLIIPEIKNINEDVLRLQEFSKTGVSTTLVILNTKENLDKIINKWDKLIQDPKFSIYFANPLSDLDKVWIIFPRTHNIVTERSSLSSGLKALAENVEEFTKEDIKRI